MQLSGPVKFATTIECHAVVITDKIVVLVVDRRVKEEIFEMTLEDTDAKITLTYEGDVLDVYPPPLVTYDLGVLRHFIFIRKISRAAEPTPSPPEN